jgi:hypothetical protein
LSNNIDCNYNWRSLNDLIVKITTKCIELRLLKNISSREINWNYFDNCKIGIKIKSNQFEPWRGFVLIETKDLNASREYFSDRLRKFKENVDEHPADGHEISTFYFMNKRKVFRVSD